MAWWDYGYQLSALANRSTIVDNNTQNISQIGLVGQVCPCQWSLSRSLSLVSCYKKCHTIFIHNSVHVDVVQAFVSSEAVALPLIRALGATHIVVLCGAFSGYESDDINKFTWMLRIAASQGAAIQVSAAHLSLIHVSPPYRLLLFLPTWSLCVQESDYHSITGGFTVGKLAAGAVHRSLLYTLCYHRYGSVYSEQGLPPLALLSLPVRKTEGLRSCPHGRDWPQGCGACWSA